MWLCGNIDAELHSADKQSYITTRGETWQGKMFAYIGARRYKLLQQSSFDKSMQSAVETRCTPPSHHGRRPQRHGRQIHYASANSMRLHHLRAHKACFICQQIGYPPNLEFTLILCHTRPRQYVCGLVNKQRFWIYQRETLIIDSIWKSINEPSIAM